MEQLNMDKNFNSSDLPPKFITNLQNKYPEVIFYNPYMTEIQDDVIIGRGTRIGSMTILHSGAVIGTECTIGSHCNICECQIGDRVSIQTGAHITRGVVLEDDVFIGPGVITLNDKLLGGSLAAPRVEARAKVGGGVVLLPSVIVGSGAIVGAGSVVTQNVMPDSIVRGQPARLHKPNE